MSRFTDLQMQGILDGTKTVTVTGGHSLLLRIMELGSFNIFVKELEGKNDKLRGQEIARHTQEKMLYEVPPNARLSVVAIATRQLIEKNLPWVFVRVEGEGVEGVIPKSVFHDLALPHAYDELTGVTYGGYKWSEMATHRVVNFKAGKCSHCQQNANSHKLYETRQSNLDAAELLGILTDQNWAQGSPAMIGIIHALADDWRVYWAAYSGKYSSSGTHPHEADFMRAVGTLAERQQAPWQYARHLKSSDKHLLCTGDDTLENIRGFAGAKFEMSQLVCAAPKLIQAAHREGDIPVAMSEIWYNPKGVKSEGNYPHGAIVDSCNLCRMSIPPMLCKRPKDFKGPTTVRKFVPRSLKTQKVSLF
ncbi:MULTISPECIES: hypothetical protein [unclassified Corallococcus]|uniref:hypothetical protein n=1 Tax=unclassified Corallococcus TaxID=2685029 RepID=UPI001A8D572C|nr:MULTISPECIES: hypothetical protein [unclassified Corallococcus]MBN9686953.1 hypothetical protein [Corallococcus sp. NCSPR001]WAS89216.1 hypothetical protein O0N60_20080 [Corallococcus sp. NCRR]